MPRHRYLCSPRWSDMDAFGHVNNTQFLAYLEQARVDLFFHLAARAGVRSLSEGTVVARHEIDYLRPVRYRHQPLRVELWCSRIAGASFTVEYEIFDVDSDDGADGDERAGGAHGADAAQDGGQGGGTDRLAVRARSLLVPYNLSTSRPRRLTPEEREFLERYLPDPVT